MRKTERFHQLINNEASNLFIVTILNSNKNFVKFLLHQLKGRPQRKSVTGHTLTFDPGINPVFFTSISVIFCPDFKNPGTPTITNRRF